MTAHRHYLPWPDTMPAEPAPLNAHRVPRQRRVDAWGLSGLLLMAVSAVAMCAWLAVLLQWVMR